MTRKRNQPPIVETPAVVVDSEEITAVWTPSPELLKHATRKDLPR